MRFPAKKRWHSLPPSGCLGTPLPLPQSVRTDGRTDVRTDGHVTITSQPKFLGLIGYHISLAMELRWRALPAGSAKIKNGILENGILVNGRCQGNLNMNNYKIMNLGYRSEDNHVVSREYISDVNGRIHLHGMVNNAKNLHQMLWKLVLTKLK